MGPGQFGKKSFILKGNTAKKTNIEGENHHFEKEIHLPNPHFEVPR